MAGLALSRLHTNQRLLVEELLQRGAEVEPFDYDLELLEVRYNGVTEYLLDRSTKTVSLVSSRLTSDKHLTKIILDSKNIRVPCGEVFTLNQKEAALSYGEKLGFPVVFKPNVGSHGFYIRADIQSAAELEAAIDAFSEAITDQQYFIIEEYFPGHEHRIFITTKGDYAVMLREPASVIGDGRRSIRELADTESARRKALKEKEGSALCPIALDPIATHFLGRRGMDFNSVPSANEKIYMRPNSNLAQGGVSKDMTDEAHPSVIAIAKTVLAAFDGLPCLGIDFLTRDIAADPALTPYAIIEVNANPGLAMHHMPAVGQPRNVARYLADVMFPFGEDTK